MKERKYISFRKKGNQDIAEHFEEKYVKSIFNMAQYPFFILFVYLMSIMSDARPNRFSEEGYFYSIAENKFLGHQGRTNTLIFTTVKMPQTFRIVRNPDSSNQSVIIKTTQTQNESLEGASVLDSSARNHDLLSYEYHGNENQQIEILFLANEILKLKNGGMCITTEKGHKYLTSMECSDSPGQEFKWVPRKDERKVSEYVQQCENRGRNRNPNPRDSRDRDSRDRPDRRSSPHDSYPRDSYPRDSYPRDSYDKPRDSYPHDSYDRPDGYSEPEQHRFLSDCFGLDETDLQRKLQDLQALAQNNDTFY